MRLLTRLDRRIRWPESCPQGGGDPRNPQALSGTLSPESLPVAKVPIHPPERISTMARRRGAREHGPNRRRARALPRRRPPTVPKSQSARQCISLGITAWLCCPKGRTVEGLRKLTKCSASVEVLVSTTASSSLCHRRGLSQGTFRRSDHYPALDRPKTIRIVAQTTAHRERFCVAPLR